MRHVLMGLFFLVSLAVGTTAGMVAHNMLSDPTSKTHEYENCRTIAVYQNENVEFEKGDEADHKKALYLLYIYYDKSKDGGEMEVNVFFPALDKGLSIYIEAKDAHVYYVFQPRKT